MSGFSVGAGYSSQAVAFFNRLATAPTTARAKQYDLLIRSLVDNGVWTLLDALWVLAAADEPSAKLNLVSTSHSLTAVNSPAHVADRGYTSDGSTSYLTGPNLSTFGGQFALNNAHLGVYVGTNVSGSLTDVGNVNSQLNSRSTTTITVRLSGGSGISQTPPATLSSIGHTLVSRADSSNISGYKNGVLVALSALASTSLNNTLLNIGNRGDQASFSTRQISAVHLGAALTAAQVGAMNAALATYMQSVGAPTP